MADEVLNANIVVLVRRGATWTARLGSELQGLTAAGPDALTALDNLLTDPRLLDWRFDPDWAPRRRLDEHDA